MFGQFASVSTDPASTNLPKSELVGRRVGVGGSLASTQLPVVGWGAGKVTSTLASLYWE
jgi:hypothetical protein